MKENPPKGTKIERTSNLRDAKAQKNGGHWDAYAVGESYVSALPLGFFMGICFWPLCWSHDAEQSRPLA